MKGRSKETPLRKRAEKKLSEKRGAVKKGAFSDMERLVHELQVHQVELEMQNDELRSAQQGIEESRSRYVDLYDFAPDGYFTLDGKGLIVEANLRGADLLGFERNLVLKTPFPLYVTPEDLELFSDFRRRVFQIPGRQFCELRLKRKKKADDPLWVRLEGVAVKSPEGKLTRVRLAASDITERKQSEDALLASEKRFQDLSAKLLNLQEMERKVLANEIHDGLLSDLAAVSFSMEAKIHQLEKAGNPIAPDFRRLLEIHRRTMQEARRIMNRLRPSILDDLGLIPALEGFSREFIAFHPEIQLECKLEAREDEVPAPLKVVIFRVAQEAMTNSLRHGGGNRAMISLTAFSKKIEFRVEDNGRGFDLENIKMGVGLQSMRERVEISGGEFQIETNPGQGTKIRAIWNYGPD